MEAGRRPPVSAKISLGQAETRGLTDTSAFVRVDSGSSDLQ